MRFSMHWQILVTVLMCIFWVPLTTVCYRCVGVLSFLAFVARLYRNPLSLNPLVMLLYERTSLPLLMGDKLLSSLALKQMRHFTMLREAIGD